MLPRSEYWMLEVARACHCPPQTPQRKAPEKNYKAASFNTELHYYFQMVCLVTQVSLAILHNLQCLKFSAFCSASLGGFSVLLNLSNHVHHNAPPLQLA